MKETNMPNQPVLIIFISLFPQFLDSFSQYSIIKKAIEKDKVKIMTLDLHQFGVGKHKKVDDYQYGPGRGMVLRLEPICDAIEAAKKHAYGKTCTILLSARGTSFNQTQAQGFIEKYQTIILISGNYEGVDERICAFIDYEISIGNYILTGGELPALVVANTLIRLIDGVIHEQSRKDESFTDNLLDYPVYTKPLVFRGKKVPSILLTGNHENIAKWRKAQALLKTKLNNPKLLDKKK